MKKIEAYVKPFKVADVRRALTASEFDMVRVHEADEIHPGQPYTEIVQGLEYETDVTSRVLLVLLVEDNQVDRAVQLIQRVAQTDNRNDGRILVTTIDRVIAVDPSEASGPTHDTAGSRRTESER